MKIFNFQIGKIIKSTDRLFFNNIFPLLFKINKFLAVSFLHIYSVGTRRKFKFSIAKPFTLEKNNIIYGGIQDTNIGHKVLDSPPQRAIVNLGPIGYYHLENCIINENSPFVYSIDENTLYYQEYPFPDFNILNLLTGFVKYKISIGFITNLKFKQYNENGIMLTGSYSSNWYHWTHDILSRVVLIEKLPDIYNDYPLIIPEVNYNSKNHLDFLKIVFPDRQLIPIKSSIKLKNCIYVDSPSISSPNTFETLSEYDKIRIGNRRTDLLQIYRKLVMDRLKELNLNNSKVYPKKIFLARKQNIRSYNQDEIFNFLKNYEFEQVFFEELDVFEQLSIMYSAEYIVGATGAAWANLLFSNAKYALIWAPECVQESNTYTKVAQVSGTDLRYIKFPTESKRWKDFKAMNKPYYVSTELIEKGLKLFDI